MKTTEHQEWDGADVAVKARPASAGSLLLLILLAVLFYLASILVALAEVDPAMNTASGSSISSTASTTHGKPRQSWFRRHFHKPTWAEVMEQCETPEDICDVVGRFVGYRSDDVDRWARAEETWERGRGDCEDFAVLIEDLCHKLGFRATVNTYFPSNLRGEGHVVVVGTWNGRLWMSSNGSYEEVGSIDEVKESVAQLFGCGKDEMWGSVMAHADIQRRLGRTSGIPVALSGP